MTERPNSLGDKGLNTPHSLEDIIIIVVVPNLSPLCQTLVSFNDSLQCLRLLKTGWNETSSSKTCGARTVYRPISVSNSVARLGGLIFNPAGHRNLALIGKKHFRYNLVTAWAVN